MDKSKIIKSKQRVKDFAEVYTPEFVVKDMCDLVPVEIWDNTLDPKTEKLKSIIKEYEK